MEEGHPTRYERLSRTETVKTESSYNYNLVYLQGGCSL